MRAGGFEPRGRDAGGEHEVKIERQALACREDISDPFFPEDVRDLVRVGHDRRGAVEEGGPGEFSRREHGTFEVYVAVDESGQDQLG